MALGFRARRTLESIEASGSQHWLNIESPGAFFFFLMRCQTPTSRDFDLIGPGGAQVCVCVCFLKLPRWFYFAARVENHWSEPILHLTDVETEAQRPGYLGSHRARATDANQMFCLVC